LQTDYIIVGQGLSGTLLSWELIREGATVLVIDEGRKYTASRTASGLINPVTGMRFVKTWLYDTLIQAAINTYSSIGHELAIRPLNEYTLLHFFSISDEEQLFANRIKQGSEFLDFLDDADVWKNYFNYEGKIGYIQPCHLLRIALLLNSWQNKMKNEGHFLEESFDFGKLKINEQGVTYQDIKASKIIFCDGVWGTQNPFFNVLPFSLNMGEAIILSIEGLPKDHLFMNDFKITPWRDDTYWIGSTFEWKYDKPLPTPAFRENVTSKLKTWLKLPYEILDHFAAERPSTYDYHPFLGLHPVHKNMAIFNGQGTKGCLQTPFFAKQMKDFLLYGKEIDK
jgi:glycine/D-amino acid oxidase-like deaminating enzyme